MRALQSASIIALLSLGAMTVAAPAVAQPYVQVDIRTRVPPPPLREYDQPPAPGYGYLWTPGYWAWDDYENQYYWVEGQWVLPPEAGYLWTPGYWGYDGDDYVFNEGYWGPTIGYYGGINYGFGYDGFGYDGGYWRGNDFYYNSYYNNFGHRHWDHEFEGHDHYNRPEGWEHRDYGDRRPDDGDHGGRNGNHGWNNGDRRSFVGQAVGQGFQNGQPRNGNGWNGGAPNPTPGGTWHNRPEGWNGANPNGQQGGAWSHQPSANQPNGWNGGVPNPQQGGTRHNQPNPGWNGQQNRTFGQPPLGAPVQPPASYQGRPPGWGQTSQPPRQTWAPAPPALQNHSTGWGQTAQPPRPTYVAPAPMQSRPASPPPQPHPAAPAQDRGQWRDRQ